MYRFTVNCHSSYERCDKDWGPRKVIELQVVGGGIAVDPIGSRSAASAVLAAHSHTS